MTEAHRPIDPMACACAHMRVNYLTSTSEGVTTGWWACDVCGHKFWPSSMTDIPELPPRGTRSEEPRRGYDDLQSPYGEDGSPIEGAVLRREWNGQKAEIDRLNRENAELNRKLDMWIGRDRAQCELLQQLRTAVEKVVRWNGDLPHLLVDYCARVLEQLEKS